MSVKLIEILYKIRKNYKQHTLVIAFLNKLKKVFGMDIRKDKYDSYYIDKAQRYLIKRSKTEKWLREQAIIEELLSEIPDGSTVLDVPFGTGRFVNFYLEKKMTVFGIDISEDMLNAAKKYLGNAYNKCNIRIGNAEHLHYMDNSFDLIVSCRFFTLISMTMARRVLAELHRVSKSKIILSIRIKKGNISAPIWIRNKRISGKICEKDLINLFKKFGFNVDKKRIILEDTNTVYLFFVLEKISKTLLNKALNFKKINY